MRSNIATVKKEMDRFECKRCGACCRERDVPLTLDDIFRLSDFMNMDPDEFFKAYCEEVAKDSDTVILPFLKKEDDKCCFLEDNICQVNFVKPSVCECMPSTMFGSLEYLRTQMPRDCAIQNTKPNNSDDERRRKSYVVATMLTSIYYSKYGTFKFEYARPFIYRILLFKRNREHIYRLMCSEVLVN